jgi:hypothetical protein
MLTVVNELILRQIFMQKNGATVLMQLYKNSVFILQPRCGI